MGLNEFLDWRLTGIGAISTVDLFVAAQLEGIDVSMRDISTAMIERGWISLSRGGKRLWYRDDVRDRRAVAMRALHGFLADRAECSPVEVRRVLEDAVGDISPKVMDAVIKYLSEARGDWYVDKSTAKTKGYNTFRRKPVNP